LNSYGAPCKRLVFELRLLGVRTLEEANRALPKLIQNHNRSFAVKPQESRISLPPTACGNVPGACVFRSGIPSHRSRPDAILWRKNLLVRQYHISPENINTMTMDNELLLVILSSVAQQEVENISSNVKKGLKMKMKRGELVGFQSCLGYDYDVNTRQISINEEEAGIVRYIFERYIAGAGAYVIAKELTQKGYKTKYRPPPLR